MVLAILKRDILALLKNPIALLVVGALLVLPGLYAWYCIVANWDPYANTGSVPIAVVNDDQGANSDIAGEVDVGAQVIAKLEDNDSIDWQFYDSKEKALADTETGLVYATIVFPEDLSKNMVGIFEGSNETPAVYYYPNEKHNAVATKVSDSAAQTLVRQINQAFSSTVNKTILQSTQKIVDQVEAKADQANASAIADIHAVQDDLDKVIASLDDASSAIDGWRTAANGASAALSASGAQLPIISSALEKGSGQLDGFRSETGTFESQLSSTILGSSSTIARLSAEASTTLSQASQDLAGVESQLQALSETARESGNADLQVAAESLDLITGIIGGLVDPVNERISEMDETVQDVSGNVSGATSQISGDVMPQLNAGAFSLATSLSKLSGAVSQFGPQITALQGVLAQTDSALDDAQGAISEARAMLGVISVNLKETVIDIGTIGNAVQVQQITDLLSTDPDNVGTFISSPVNMVTEQVFPVSNYGTAVAPFYTNLALWIGCFILVSLIKVEVNTEGLGRTTANQRYFGRWMLFMILAILQSQVICGVDILLGIDCGNAGYFMMAGCVCSIAYMNIIFALVSTFRNIGKTLCILLLIMQVPGSSGMYPIEMMPQFFQFIHPALPFTYGIDAMREALSGMYGDRFLFDLSFLLLTIPVSLLLGVGIRPALSNLTLLFDREMSATGFFASEVHAQATTDRVRELMRALSASDEMRDSIEERAWRFRRNYPRLRRIGTIAIMVIPFLYLFVMLPFNLNAPVDINVKLGTLLLMVIVLIVVQFALIALEYMHRTVTEQTRALGFEILSESGLMGDLGTEFDLLKGMSGEDDETGGAQASAAPRFKSPTWDIFSTDMRLGFHSVIGVVVIVLLVITPSMYAWFNIAGSWDPYSSTGNLKVAVANEDEGYKSELVPVTVNVGDTVLAQLRGNDSFDWVFVDEQDAISGVEGSTYYAAIVIPADFSANMMTYLTEDSDYPDVVYYTNEKENPIAPIITQKGADAIQENIRASFTERVDQVVLTVAYDVLNYVTNPRMSDYVVKMSRHLDDATGDSKSAARELRELASLSNTVSAIVDATGDAAEGLQAAGSSAKTAVGDAEAGLKDAVEAFSRATSIANTMLGSRSIDVSEIQGIVNAALELLEGGAGMVPDLIQDEIDQFKAMKATGDEKAQRNAIVKSLKKAKARAESVPGKVSTARDEVETLIGNAVAEVAEAKSYFDDTVTPSVNDLRATMGEVTASTSQVVGGIEDAVSGVGESTDGLSSQLTQLSGGLVKAGDRLEGAATSLENTKARVAEALASGDVMQIEAVILGGDPEGMSKSLAVPVLQQREAFYAVSNYGSAMAPFYTVLSLWVGALVMISTMRVHLVEERVEQLRERYGRLRPRHEFFGRYGIFGFIGLLQGLLVLLGDLLFLHIQCASPVLFVVFGLFIGQIFCLIVYTLTELFGDVGKALCVILLIMQVAASGGTFPVEMLDPILMNVSQFLPFYHAMSLLQECVAGIDWVAVIVYSLALVIMAGFALLMGLPLRRPFRKLNDFFEEQLEKTGYM